MCDNGPLPLLPSLHPSLILASHTRYNVCNNLQSFLLIELTLNWCHLGCYWNDFQLFFAHFLWKQIEDCFFSSFGYCCSPIKIYYTNMSARSSRNDGTLKNILFNAQRLALQFSIWLRYFYPDISHLSGRDIFTKA